MDSSKVEWNPRTDAGTTKYELFSMNKFNFVWEINNLHKGALKNMDSYVLSSPLFPSEEKIFEFTLTKNKGVYYPIWSIILKSKEDPIFTKYTIIFLAKNNCELETHTGFFIFTEKQNKIEDDINPRVHNAWYAGPFASMFDSDFKESELKKVKIEDIEPEDFEEFLRFLYSEKADIDKYALGLLKAADKYDVSSLKGICEEELLKSLTEDNCLEILVEADLRLAKRLKEKAMEIIISNKSFVATQEWKDFKKIHRDLADEVYDFGFENLRPKEN